MTANAEATGAREALLHACADLNCDGETEASALVREFADKHYPAPAPRRVRAEVQSGLCKWVRCADGSWDVQGGDGSPHKVRKVRCAEIAQMAALDARADAEGMVEEGLGAAAPKSEATVIPRGSQAGTTSPAPTFITLAGMPAGSCNVAGCGCQMGAQSSGTAPPSDDPPASRVAGQSDAPSPQNGAQAGEDDVDDFDYRGALEELGLGENVAPNVGDAKAQGVQVDALPCSDAPTPFITMPKDAQFSCCVAGCRCQEEPTPSASPEADKRMWLVSRDVESGELGVINLVAQASRDRTDQEWQRMCQYSTDHVRVVPLSDLARVQRERDEAKMLLRVERDAGRLLGNWLREYRAELTATRAERDAALDRARVAEQRIETGVECWRTQSGYVVGAAPTKMAAEFYGPFGPFTRGRFVADTEGA